MRGLGREHLRRQRRRDRHAGPQTAGILDGINRKSVDPDRPRPRLRGRRARHRPRRALPRRRGLHDRHGRRADAGARDRRPRRSARASPARSRARSRRVRRRAARPRRALPRVARRRAGRRHTPREPRSSSTTPPCATACGEGMSLTAAEKVRVAHVLDELGIDLDRGRLPVVEPEGGRALRPARARALRHAEIAAFGMTRRRDLPPRTTTALRVLADCFAPVCTLVGKTWGLHLEKVVRVDREENLRMIAESVAFLVGRASASSTTPSTSSTAGATTADYALRCAAGGAPRRAPRRVVTLCDTNGALAARTRSRRRRPPSRAALRRARSASTATTTRGAAWRTRSRPSRRAPRRSRAR